MIFPELAVTGYPPKDLLLKRSFINENYENLRKIISFCEKIAVIIGFVDSVDNRLYNAAALIYDGELIGIQHKIHLPNYDVFDEKRYFHEGDESKIFELNDLKIGINICEDIWIKDGPVEKQCELGAELIINISASPFHFGKDIERESIISDHARRNGVPIIYANLVGGQDDLIFDGKSYLFDSAGNMIVKGRGFEEEFIVLPELGSAELIKPTYNDIEDIYKALVLGTGDYVRKNGFKKVIVGSSGGIDSALTVAIAVDALGKENVLTISMPSKFSSKGSIEDAKKLAENLGISFDVIPIKEIYDSYISSLSDQFKGTEFNVAEENIQARIRGNILMAISNKFGYLVLSTGNKSELSVGYATLYGDMSGGLAVLSDVMKTKVYEICRYLNEKGTKEIIPEAIINKAPSAELKEDQRDTDSLPEYDILDPILKCYVEETRQREEIISMGFDKDVVDRVIRLVDRNEYKRQQAALGLRITTKAFGFGRRMPITNIWVEN